MGRLAHTTRACGEWREQIAIAAESHPNGARSPHGTLAQTLPLTAIVEPGATPADEFTTGNREHKCRPPAATAQRPTASTAEVTRRVDESECRPPAASKMRQFAALPTIRKREPAAHLQLRIREKSTRIVSQELYALRYEASGAKTLSPTRG